VELQDILHKKEARLQEIRTELAALKNTTVDEADLRKALGLFDPVWDALYPAERRRVLHLLIERVDYDAKEGRVALAFRPTGIRTLAAEAME
jgi:site-specific DNA recombinase